MFFCFIKSLRLTKPSVHSLYFHGKTINYPCYGPSVVLIKETVVFLEMSICFLLIPHCPARAGDLQYWYNRLHQLQTHWECKAWPVFRVLQTYGTLEISQPLSLDFYKKMVPSANQACCLACCSN